MPNPFRPAVFQGSMSRRNYFEGWYFKLAQADGAQAAVIVGVALGDDRHAFIQALDSTGSTPLQARWPVECFHSDRRRFAVEIAGNRFSLDGMELDIAQGGRSLRGQVRFHGVVPYPSTPWPGIMGPFGFLPGMECSHGIVSIRHGLSGALSLDGSSIDFDGGVGYIEKDWGTSFPSSWLWVHANRFGDDGTFLMSLANIPLGRYHFPGFFAFLHHKGQLKLFATYNRSRVESIRAAQDGVRGTVTGPAGRLTFLARSGQLNPLLGPRMGHMDRPVHESLDAHVHVRLCDHGGRLLYEGESDLAGMERCGELPMG